MYRHIYLKHGRDIESVKKSIHKKYLKQRFDYDCGASCLNNFLLHSNSDRYHNYDELIEYLKTNEEIGTYPENIVDYLHKRGIKVDCGIEHINKARYAIILVDYIKFLPESEENYGHYLFADIKKQEIFDPYTGRVSNLKHLKKSSTINVKVGLRLYSNYIICIS